MTRIFESPVEGQDVWHGPAISKESDWIYHLGDADIKELRQALSQAVGSGKPMFDWVQSDFPLSNLKQKIEQWMEELNHGRGFKLLKGFPVMAHTKDECAKVYWGLGLYMGTTVSQNADGDLLTDIRDTGIAPEPGVRLYKTRAEQDFHIDGSDVVGLFCLRPGKSGGISQIVSSSAIYNEVMRREPELIPVLYDRFPFDNHGQEKPGENPWFEMPICRMEEGRLRTFFIPWYIRGSQRFEKAPRLTSQQERCVELYESIANDPAFHLNIDFEPGDMQFLKNTAILHKRTEYEDWEDEDAKRHLLRLWLTAYNFSGDLTLRQGVSPKSAQQAVKQ